MSVAIVTRYLGPTNHRGSRIVASVPARIADCHPEDAREYATHRPSHWRLTVPYSYELSGEDVHRAAAQALADRLGWEGELVAGGLADGYAFCFRRDGIRKCAACGAPMETLIRSHHHSENGKDVTR